MILKKFLATAEKAVTGNNKEKTGTCGNILDV
jgi:hypothetical protein